jgi:hypothetical protein
LIFSQIPRRGTALNAFPKKYGMYATRASLQNLRIAKAKITGFAHRRIAFHKTCNMPSIKARIKKKIINV